MQIDKCPTLALLFLGGGNGFYILNIQLIVSTEVQLLRYRRHWARDALNEYSHNRILL